jgi:hypothetical protein
VALSRQRVRRAPRTQLLRILLGLYIAAAALLPFAHHDIACHFKSTTHCTSCIVGAAGDLATDGSGLGRTALDGAGSPASDPENRIDSLSLPSASGRAPPSV